MLGKQCAAAAAFALAVAVLVAPARGQSAYVLDGMAPPLTQPIYLPSAAYPAGAFSPFGPLPLRSFGAAATPGLPPPAGGMAIDQLTFTVYASDGLVLTTDSHPGYVLFLCPGGNCPPTPPVAAPVLLGGGPISGLAVDSLGGVLYLCDAVSFQAFALNIRPAPVPLGPPIPIPANAPISGLDFEPGTGTLWACDLGGGVYNFTPAGVPLAVFPPVIAPAAPVGGLAIAATSGQPGDLLPPPCSGQVRGFHVMITDALFIYDALNPAAAPIPFPPLGPLAYGLAVSNDGQITPSASPRNRASIFTNHPAYIAPAPPGIPQLGIRIFTNNPAAQPILSPVLLLDLCPGIPLPMPWGGNICMNLATSFFLPGLPDPNLPGAFLIPLPPGLPAGLQVSAQWVFIDPLAPPLQISHTDCLTLTFGRP